MMFYTLWGIIALRLTDGVVTDFFRVFKLVDIICTHISEENENA